VAKVCVLHPIPGNAKEILEKEEHQVVFGEENLAGANAVLSLLTDKIGAEFFDKAGPGLQIVANYAVGYDNIDVAEAARRKIFVTNTPGGFVEAVAEHTLALTLAVAKRLVEADKYMREGKFVCWQPDLMMGSQLYGKEFGVVGLGRIGSYAAKVAHFGFSMQILYYSHKPNMEVEAQMGGMFFDNLDDLLKRADVVSLHVPLNDETRHMIGAPQLSMMKKSAILINTARGAIADEAALVTALKEGWIAGAGMDVYEEEGKGSGVNPELLKLNNVVLTPHCASATLEARASMAEIAAQNIIDTLSGKKPRDLVNG
jgi:glyoxylate reductase